MQLAFLSVSSFELESRPIVQPKQQMHEAASNLSPVRYSRKFKTVRANRY